MAPIPAADAQPAHSAARNRPLKVGLILPDTEREMGGATARWSDLVEMAQLAETLGFDSLWNADHLIYRFAGPGRAGTVGMLVAAGGVGGGDAAGGAGTAGQLHLLPQSRPPGQDRRHHR